MHRVRLFYGNHKLGYILPKGMILCALAMALLAAGWALPQTALAAKDGKLNDRVDANIPITSTNLSTLLATDVLQPGYAIYTSQAYEPNQPTLAVRDLRLIAQRYADPANLAGSAVDNSPFAP